MNEKFQSVRIVDEKVNLKNRRSSNSKQNTCKIKSLYFFFIKTFKGYLGSVSLTVIRKIQDDRRLFKLIV